MTRFVNLSRFAIGILLLDIVLSGAWAGTRQVMDYGPPRPFFPLFVQCSWWMLWVAVAIAAMMVMVDITVPVDDSETPSGMSVDELLATKLPVGENIPVTCPYCGGHSIVRRER